MKEWFGKSEIILDPSSPENDEGKMEMEKKIAEMWTSENIREQQKLAKRVWRAIRISPADLVFDRVIQESFPQAKPSEWISLAERMFECVSALAQQEQPEMNQRISPEDFARFANLYLVEKLG